MVGAGSWGSAFAALLKDRGHDVTLAARDPVQVEAIRETGRNPRYLPDADLRGIAAVTIADAPLAETDLVAVAVPSAVFADVVESLPGTAPVLSLTKGLDPATESVCRRSSGTGPLPSSRARTSLRRSRAASRPLR